MMDLHEMNPTSLCYELDRVCKPYYFTFSSGPDVEGPLTKLHVYPASARQREEDLLAVFVVDQDNPLEYVLTKILLLYSGGTPVA